MIQHPIVDYHNIRYRATAATTYRDVHVYTSGQVLIGSNLHLCYEPAPEYTSTPYTSHVGDKDPEQTTSHSGKVLRLRFKLSCVDEV